MRVIDASSIVHAWDNYPIENFPKFWDWIAHEFSSGKFILPKVAMEEVAHVSPPCYQWLQEHGVDAVDVDSAIAHLALSLKTQLGINNDDYSSGVDENDLIVIATAKILSQSLISNEARQPKLPTNKKKYKIPAVCALPTVKVVCMDVAELIRKSKKVF